MEIEYWRRKMNTISLCSCLWKLCVSTLTHASNIRKDGTCGLLNIRKGLHPEQEKNECQYLLHLQENANHSDAIRLLQSLSKGVILWIPVNQVKLQPPNTGCEINPLIWKWALLSTRDPKVCSLRVVTEHLHGSW